MSAHPDRNDTFIPPLRHTRRRRRITRFIFRFAVLCLLLAFVDFGYNWLTNKAFRQTSQAVFKGANPVTAFGGRRAVTLMILGKDEDRNNRSQVMATNARSDVILLARLDFDAKTINILSIPRDTRVHIPRTRGYSKINAAHAIGGPELTAETLHEFIGVKPDSSLVVDYKMLQNVIDRLGGVTVKVDKKLDYDDNWGNLHIHLKPGVQTLNGRDAMGFVRYRHANEGAADSDLERIARQQELLHSVKGKLKQPATWLRLPGALETVRREMRGTLTYPQLVSLALFARSVPKDNVVMQVLPNRPGRFYVYADTDAARVMVARMFPVDSSAQYSTERGSEERPTRRPRTTQPRPVDVTPEEPAVVPDLPAVTEETPAPEPVEESEPEVAVEAAPVEPAPAEETAPAPENPSQPE